MASHDMKLSATLPPAPTTQRAVPARLDAHRNTIAYGSGSCVIVRCVDASAGGPDEVLVCSLHRSPVTAVRFSPTGALIASGDQSGCLILFANKTGTPEKLSSHLLQGPIHDIAWTADGERLVVVGEGKAVFGVAISNTGNSIALTASLASEGAPFVFKTNTPGHSGPVTCVRYCPAVNEVATCSSAADLLILDGTTGERKRQIPSGHTGTVYSLSWSPDGAFLATASADKHVHIVKAADGTIRHKVSLGDAVTDMQQGVVWLSSAGVVSVSLRGALTFIQPETGKVAGVQVGHQGRIVRLHVCEGSGDLLSLSAEGKLIRWFGASTWRTNALVPLPASADVINSAAVRGGGLYIVAGNAVLVYDTTDADGAAAVKVLSPNAGGFSSALAVTAAGQVVIAFRTKVVVLDEAGRPLCEEKLPSAFNATTVAAARAGSGGGGGHKADTVVVGGERAVTVFRVMPTGTLSPTGVELAGHHAGAVSSVAASHTGDRVASADGTSRHIVVWSPASGEVLVQRPMCHHSAAVTCMAFANQDETRMLSGGLDCTVMAWDLASGTRKMQDGAHRSGVSAVAWGRTAGADVVSSGGDLCIKHWAL